MAEPSAWNKPKGNRRQVLLVELRQRVNRLVRLLLIEEERAKAVPSTPEIVVKFLPTEEQETLSGLAELLAQRR
jgi:hypothetical protein